MRPEIIIFSKNRACQLDLLLRSLNLPVKVLWACDPMFMPGYNKLIDNNPQVEFVEQDNFKEQLLKMITKEYILFLTDDDVMIGGIDDFKGFDDDVVSLSLGLYPRFGTKWEWKLYRHHRGPARYYGYPMSVACCIFRGKDLLPIIEKSEITNPNTLEAALNSNIPNKPYMTCLDSIRVVNNSANQVQKEFPTKVVGITVEELESQFMRGRRISLEDIKQKTAGVKNFRLMTDYKYV